MMSRSSPVFFPKCLTQLVLWGILFAAAAAAQQTAEPDLELQRQAMRKLAPLVGKWSGGTRWFTVNTTIELNFGEEVDYEQNGLALRMHGSGSQADGRVVIGSTNLVSYDDRSGKYRVARSHDKNEGMINVDEDGKGITIDFPTPQQQTSRARIRINEDGYWTEMHWVTEKSGKPWMFLAGVLQKERSSPPGQKAGLPPQKAGVKQEPE